MSNQKFTEEFKEEAVKQIKDRGYKVSEVSKRLGVSPHSLYKWLKQDRGNSGRHGKDHEEALLKEIIRLKNDLKRVERLMKQYRLKAFIGYKKPRYKSGKPSNVVPNQLGQSFDFQNPDEAWVTDITY